MSIHLYQRSEDPCTENLNALAYGNLTPEQRLTIEAIWSMIGRLNDSDKWIVICTLLSWVGHHPDPGERNGSADTATSKNTAFGGEQPMQSPQRTETLRSKPQYLSQAEASSTAQTPLSPDPLYSSISSATENPYSLASLTEHEVAGSNNPSCQHSSRIGSSPALANITRLQEVAEWCAKPTSSSSSLSSRSGLGLFQYGQDPISRTLLSSIQKERTERQPRARVQRLKRLRGKDPAKPYFCLSQDCVLTYLHLKSLGNHMRGKSHSNWPLLPASCNHQSHNGRLYHFDNWEASLDHILNVHLETGKPMTKAEYVGQLLNPSPSHINHENQVVQNNCATGETQANSNANVIANANVGHPPYAHDVYNTLMDSPEKNEMAPGAIGHSIWPQPQAEASQGPPLMQPFYPN